MTRVLVVDDDPAIAEVVAAILQDEGYACATAENGAEALRALSEQRFDLVISDVMMPSVDGRELLQRIRGSPTPKRVPVVLMSAAIERDGAGAAPDAFLRKPFGEDQLLGTVAELTRGGSKRRPALSDG